MDRLVIACLMWLAAGPVAAAGAASPAFHDPLQPPAALLRGDAAEVTPARVETALVLQAILRSEKEAVAIINGHRVKIGQMLEGGYTLVRLGTTDAELAGPSGRRVLRLVQAVKRTQQSAQSLSAAADPADAAEGKKK